MEDYRAVAFVPRRFLAAALGFAAISGAPTGALAATGNITTVVGNGTAAIAGDGGQASAANVAFPTAVVPTDDGGYLIADNGNTRVRRVSPSGVITTLAGSTEGFAGDGGPATSAKLSAPNGIAVLADGSVLIADSNNNRIRKVATNGIITTVAGGNSGGAGQQTGYSGDGGPATAAKLSFPIDVAALSDGGYLIADKDNNVIRRVSPAGIITTVAGGGTAFPAFTGTPATQIRITQPTGLAVYPDDSYLVTMTGAPGDGTGYIDRITNQGIATRVAGSGSGGEVGQAAGSTLDQPSRIALLDDGSFIFAERGTNVIRRVPTNGKLLTLAGTGALGASGDNGPAGAARLNKPVGVGVSLQGDVLIGDADNHRVRKVDLGDPPIVGAPVWRDIGAAGTVIANGTSSSSLDGVTLAAMGNGATVAWREFRPGGGANQYAVLAKMLGSAIFNGGQWRQLGSDLPYVAPGSTPNELSSATIGGKPYVAMTQTVNGFRQVRVYRWDGDAWREPVTGPNPINISPTRNAKTPEIVGIKATPTSEEQPWVVWVEGNGTADQIRVKRFVAGAGATPGSWQEAGSGAGPVNSTPGTNAFAPTITEVGGVPFVSFSQVVQAAAGGTPQTSAIHVRRYQPSTNNWFDVGTGATPLTHYVSGGAPQWDSTTPTMQSVAGVPYVVWSEHNELWSARYAGGGVWESLGRVDPSFGAVTYPSSPSDPSMAIVGGTPWVAWRELNSAGNSRIYAYRYNGSGWDGTFSPVTGEPSGIGSAGPPTLRSVSDVPVVAFGEVRSPRDVVRVMGYGDPPTNSRRPTMTGVPKVGSPLTCNAGAWTGSPAPTFTYLWDRAPRGTTADDDAAWGAINGATGSSYVPKANDAGSRVRCRVVASIPSLGFREAVTNSRRVDVDVPANTSLPLVVGGQTDADTLTCEPGDWTNGPDLTYQWLRNGQPVAGATAKTYRDSGDIAPTISCRVSGSNDIGAGQPADSAGHRVFGNIPVYKHSARVLIESGGPILGRRIVCEPGVWDWSVDFTYAWFRNGNPVAGLTGPEYKSTVDDLGRNLSCEITSRNPKGEAKRATEDVLFELPPGTKGGVMMQAGGLTELDPKNMLAVSSDYLDAVGKVAQQRRTAVVNAERTRCQGVKGATDKFDLDKPQLSPPTEVSRCQVLVQAFDRVVITARSVQYRMRRSLRLPPCYVDGESEIVTFEGRERPADSCPSLNIDIPPVSSSDPPVQDADFAATVAPMTPKEILYDVNGDNKTDAVCPGTAPVLRTLFDKGDFEVRALIVAQDSELTGIFASAYGPVYSGGLTDPKGVIRPAQDFACRTGLTPPPNPDLGPCVTQATIGRVKITDANLCPISVRAITPAQLKENFPDNPDGSESEDYKILKGIAESLDLGGEKAKQPRYVPEPGFMSVKAHPFANAISAERIASATFTNTVGSVAKFGDLAVNPQKWTVEPASAARLSSTALIDKLKLNVPQLDIDKGAFALDQIYLAKDGLKINGVSLDPLKDVTPMLIPSEVQEAIDKPSYKSMRVLARKANEYLGDPASGLPLADGKQIRATLNDAKEKGQAILDDAVDLDAVKRSISDAADKLNLGPFKLTGQGDIKLEDDGTATLTAVANFDLIKDVLGAPFKVKVTIKGDLKGNVKLQGIEMSVPHGAKLGPLDLDGLFVRVNNGVTIKGKIVLPGTGEGINIVDFTLDGKGRLMHFEVYYIAGTGSGIPIAPPTPMYLIEVGGGIDNPYGPVTTLIGGAKVAVGPSVTGGCAAADVNVGLKVAVGGNPTLVATARGDVSVLCLPLGTMDFYVDSRGLIKFDGHVHFDAGPLFLDGNVGARMYLPEWQISVDGQVGLKDLPIVGDVKVGSKFALSSKGAAACVSIDLFFDDFSGGLGVKFSNGRPPLSVVEFLANLRPFLGCDLSKFLPLSVSGAVASKSAAAPAGTSFKLPSGGGTTLLSIEGAGSAPHVLLRSPSGQTFDFTHADPAVREKTYSGQIREQEDRTVVALKNPEGGTWTALPAEGSSKVVRVQAAHKLADPKVKVKAGGKGAKRTLKYDVEPIEGQRVDFVEQSDKGLVTIGSVKGGGKGTFKYSTSEDASRSRTVIANVVQDDMPRTSLTVAKYSAPAPSVGKPKVKVKRSSQSATVSWTKAALAKTYTVLVVGTRSGTHSETVKAKKRKLKIGGLEKGETLTVTVVAVSPAGRQGKSKTLVLKEPKKKAAKKKRR